MSGVVQVTKTVAAVNDETGTIPGTAPFNIGIRGSGWSATIDLMRSTDSGVTFFTVKQYTAPAEEVGEDGVRWGTPALYKLRCTAYTSGSPVLYLEA